MASYVILHLLFFILPVHGTYKAAVVEFSVDQVSPDRQQRNLVGFTDAVKSLVNEGVQIVVFPEDAINGAFFFNRDDIFPFLEEIPDVPQPEIVLPCLDYKFDDRLVLKNLSCLARQYNLILVANMGEKKNCSQVTDRNCPPDGRYQFNTNVVFETDGSLVAKYHKINLYGAESGYFDPGDSTACVTFKSTFGVVFGTFTCYDMLFDTPSKCLLAKGIKNYVFPTAWGNAYAFYMSTSVQQGWSRKNQVNVLAANWHGPNALLHGTGSGIYSAGVARKYIFSGQPLNMSSGRILVSQLEEDPSKLKDFTQEGILMDVGSAPAKDESLYSDFQMLNSSEGVAKITHENTNPKLSLTCTLHYKMRSAISKEHYAVGAFIGEHPDNFFYAVCSVLKCNDSQCGRDVSSHLAETVFERIRLHGTFPEGSTLLPTALASGLVLLNKTELITGKNSLSITGMTQPLLAASLWTRVYPNGT